MLTTATIHWITSQLSGFATRHDNGEHIYIPVPVAQASGLEESDIGSDIEVKIVRNGAVEHASKNPWRAVKLRIIEDQAWDTPKTAEQRNDPIRDITQDEVLDFLSERRDQLLLAQDIADELRDGFRLSDVNKCEFSRSLHSLLRSMYAAGLIDRADFYRASTQTKASHTAYCYDVGLYFDGDDDNDV